MRAAGLPASQRYDAERAVRAGIPYEACEKYKTALRGFESDRKDGASGGWSRKEKQLMYINMQNGTSTQKLILADSIGYRDDMAVLLGVLPEVKIK